MAASIESFRFCLGILVVLILVVCLDKVPDCLGTAQNLTNTFALTRAQRQCQDYLLLSSPIYRPARCFLS